MVTIFTEHDVIDKSYELDYSDKWVILKLNSLASKYQTAEYQLFKAVGGFGCDPIKMGRSVYGYFAVDNEECTFDRSAFLGIATDEALSDWKKMYHHVL